MKVIDIERLISSDIGTDEAMAYLTWPEVFKINKVIVI
jgi:hypothetical protein